MYKILVIDDDRIIVEMLRLMLEYAGYKVVMSFNPEQVIPIVDQEKIDLILLDHFLLGGSGIEICKGLKQNEVTKGVPILMMSALKEVKNKCIDAGAAGFVAKPFERKRLLSQIEEQIN